MEGQESVQAQSEQMSNEEVQELKKMLETIETTPESINKIVSFMQEKSQKGCAKHVVEVWKEQEAKVKDNAKLPFYYVLHECVARFQEDDMKLLMAFPDVLNERFFNSLTECSDKYARGEIIRLIQLWNQHQFYSPKYIKFLQDVFEDVEKKHPVKPKINEFGVAMKVKFFAIYYRNYNQCKESVSALEKEIKELTVAKDTKPETLEAKVNSYESALTSLKVNRRNLLKSVVQLTKDFRQSLSVRLHMIQELESLKEEISQFIDNPKEMVMAED